MRPRSAWDPTINDLFQAAYESDVRQRIAERRLRRVEWRLWSRYLRLARRADAQGARVSLLAALAILTTLNDAMEADLRFMRRVMAHPANAGVEFAELVFEPESK